MYHFSVLDVETTGFSPKCNDRVLEIGITKIDSDGKVIDQFDTLLNPNRDVGPTQIHGITAEMIQKAPAFEEIASNVLMFLNESIIVAHNANFDIRFLQNEFELSGYRNLNWPCLCTLKISRELLPELPSKKLECLCDFFDVQNTESHTAINDSLATARIFEIFLNKFNYKKDINKDCQFQFCSNPLKKVPKGFIALPRNDFLKAQRVAKSPLEDVFKKLPDIETKNANEASYLNLLDTVLLDRIISDNETEQILTLAEDFKLSKSQFKMLNQKYLENLIEYYLADDIISESELKDLKKVSQLLMINSKNLELIASKVKTDKEYSAGCKIKKNNFEGKTVCFTGTFTCKHNGEIINRKKTQEIALEKGLILKNSVTKKLDFLVLADPLSNSGKAKKARALNIELIEENVFWQMVGIQVE